jgi:GldM C-terminal domain
MQSPLKRLCFIFFLRANHVFFAQNVTVVSSERMNIFYIGLDNPVAIAMEKVSAADLNVKISGSNSIDKVSNGNYVVRVNRPRRVKISVEGNGSVVEKEFRAKPIPDPQPTINLRNQVNGVLTIGEVKAITGLIANIVNFDIDARCAIESFSVAIRHSDGNSDIIENKGGGFGNELLKTLNSVKTNDYIMFYNISTRCPGDPTARKLQAISFIIK